MSLKQIEQTERITFLKKFTAEFLINSEEEKPPKSIEIEKIKQKFLEPVKLEKDFEKSINVSFFQKPIYPREIKKELKHSIKKPLLKLKKRKPILHRIKTLRKPILKKTKQITKPIIKQITKSISPQAQALTNIQPKAQARPAEFGLGNLEPLIKDVSIQSIECPGPRKNILVKQYNKINVTKTILSQEEITNIINNFSEKARIPIMGGILKAAVGDLIISAIISEFVGSRFIINKITPYSMIQ